jgi:MOSC domain-containing protein YiiM
MDPVQSAELVVGRGLVGNANQGGRRQLTIIDREAWQSAMAEAGGSLPPSARRANLMVSGVSLEKTRGRIMEIGECRVEVLGETRPCERMEEALPGLKAALDPAWRGGVFAAVATGGTIHVGDHVAW